MVPAKQSRLVLRPQLLDDSDEGAEYRRLALSELPPHLRHAERLMRNWVSWELLKLLLAILIANLVAAISTFGYWPEFSLSTATVCTFSVAVFIAAHIVARVVYSRRARQELAETDLVNQFVPALYSEEARSAWLRGAERANRYSHQYYLQPATILNYARKVKNLAIQGWDLWRALAYAAALSVFIAGLPAIVLAVLELSLDWRLLIMPLALLSAAIHVENLAIYIGAHELRRAVELDLNQMPR